MVSQTEYERLLNRVNSYSKKLGKLLSTEEEQEFVKGIFEPRFPQSDINKRVVAALKLPPGIQALIRESYFLAQQEEYFRTTEGQLNEAAAHRLNTRLKVINLLFIKWFMGNPIRFKMLWFMNRREYKYFISNTWMLCVIKNNETAKG